MQALKVVRVCVWGFPCPSLDYLKATNQEMPRHLNINCLECLRCFFLSNWNTLPETKGSPLKMDGWKATSLLGPGLFSGAFAVSFREGTVVITPPKLDEKFGSEDFDRSNTPWIFSNTPWISLS